MRFAILYFVLFVFFLALIVGPVVAGKYATSAIGGALPSNGPISGLFQPVGLNDTYAKYGTTTGTWIGRGTGMAAAGNGNGNNAAATSGGGSGGGGGGGGGDTNALFSATDLTAPTGS